MLPTGRGSRILVKAIGGNAGRHLVDPRSGITVRRDADPWIITMTETGRPRTGNATIMITAIDHPDTGTPRVDIRPTVDRLILQTETAPIEGLLPYFLVETLHMFICNVVLSVFVTVDLSLELFQ